MNLPPSATVFRSCVKKPSAQVSHVSWKPIVSIRNDGIHYVQDKSVKFTCFHPCAPCLEVSSSCQLSIEDLPDKLWLPIKVFLHAKIAQGDFTDGSHQISRIWGNVNQNERVLMEKLPGRKGWNSKDFVIMSSKRAPRTVDFPTITIRCEIWIEFQTMTTDRTEKNALSQLSDMFTRQTRCDVQFCFDDKNCSFGAHKAVLSARSPVFDSMFQQDEKIERINIGGLESEIFKELVHFIYSGRIDRPLDEESAQKLYQAAAQYEINDLQDECIVFLLPLLHVDNAIRLLVWSHLNSAISIKERSLCVIGHHGQAICNSIDWEMLTKKYPELSVMATRRMMVGLNIDNKSNLQIDSYPVLVNYPY